MVIASDLREGMVLRIDGQIFRVLEVQARGGAAKMSGVVKTKLFNVKSGRMWEPHFRTQEKLEDLEVERRNMEFLYSDNESCTFMRPDTFDQLAIAHALVGPARDFLQPGMELPVEFFEGDPISVVVPDIADARIATTAPPSRSQADSAWKEAILENGMAVRVPLFIAPGETVRIEIKTGRYVERAHDHKRIA